MGTDEARPRITWPAVVVPIAVLMSVVVTAVVINNLRTSSRWNHGGDDVDLQAQVLAVEPRDYPAAMTSLGLTDEGLARAGQMVVVDLSWTDAPSDLTQVAFVLMDGRVDQPRPVHAYQVWDSDGTVRGAGWDSRYAEVADHYAWLRGLRDQNALSLPFDGGPTGAGILAFWLDRDQLPTDAPADDLRLAMIAMDGGDPQWVREAELEPLVLTGLD